MRRLREKMILSTEKSGTIFLILYMKKLKSRKMKCLDLLQVSVLVSDRCKYQKGRKRVRELILLYHQQHKDILLETL